jgi:hypothetical protein
VNTKATADAIAAQFAGMTTAAGATIAVGPTASLPNTITVGPALLVYHPTGVLDVLVSKIRSDELDFPVKLLMDPLNVPVRSDALYDWYDAMRDKVEAHMTLGLPYVSWARCISMRAELDGESYAGGIFDVVELMVRVHFGDIVTTLGP